MGCHSLLQGIFLTQVTNLGLLHCGQILYHLRHQGSPISTQKNIYIYATQAYEIYIYICIFKKFYLF